MKNEDLFLLALFGGGMFVMARYLGNKTRNSAPPPSGATYGATEIMRDNGWVYYTDGTSIGPDGRYYQGSDLVYDPRGMYK
ncbi:MAG TPA: hypothetical protein VF800_11675 [Telluria sp.]|jgi:hypothetical protein